MIGLQKKGVHSSQALHRIVVVGAKVRHHSDLLFSAGKPVRHRIRRIMGDPHGIHRHILDGKAFVRPYRLKQAFIDRPQASAAADGLHRFGRGIDRHIIFSGKNAQPADVVAVLMGDENRVQDAGIDPQAVKPFFRPLSADPHIHQNMGGIRPHINAVSAAAAGNAA